MADEITPRFNLVKPEVGGSADTWGDKWNENADKIDANALNRQTDLASQGGTIPETNRLNVWESDQRLENERALLFSTSDDSSTAARGGMIWESTEGVPQFRVSYQHSQERLLFFGYGSGGSDLVGAIHRNGAWVIGDGTNPDPQDPGTLNAKNGLYDGGERVYSPKNDANLVKTSRTISTGTGLTGGGDLSANRTISIDPNYDASLVKTSRTISTGTGLTGGGNLAANRTISLASSHIPIGVGQTWQYYTTSQRALGVTYTNTTGRPIFVAVVGPSSSQPIAYELRVSGQVISSGASVSGLVPPASTYRVSSETNDFDWWSELR